ncbi:MAG: dehypoxanthine futalosine cyclase [bacterium]|nr:dehypoxanthine futalosine cyclase [bacterium]
MKTQEQVAKILEGAIRGKRISPEEAVILFKEAEIYQLGAAADKIRRQRFIKNQITFIIDRNINYTNICVNQCGFCAFWRDADSPEGYLLNEQEILGKVEEAVNDGATQIMLQGGLHPDIKIGYYLKIFKAVKNKYKVVLHSLSAPEIMHLCKNNGLSIEEVIMRLKLAGLDSLPGAGAEILTDVTRKRISGKKINVEEWLLVMETAHRLGMYSTATMMFGVGEELSERVEHMDSIRKLQDKTERFRGFIPWTFQPGCTKIGGKEVPAEDYLRTLAISRLYLDNVPHIQGSWLTQGEEIGQLSLFFGADDLGSIMLEENVVRATGVSRKMNTDKIVRLIQKAGFTPCQRDTEYKIIKEY